MHGIKFGYIEDCHFSSCDLHFFNQVTWVEHVEVEEKIPVHQMYRDFAFSGLAFGAKRWLATLERMCERMACLMVTGNAPQDLGGGKQNFSFFLFQFAL